MGSPWTLATYLIEGGSTPLYKKIKTMTHAAPAVLQALLSHLATQIATYMCYQIESGAHCVQLFDSWGGQLPPAVRVPLPPRFKSQQIHPLTKLPCDSPCVFFTQLEST